MVDDRLAGNSEVKSQMWECTNCHARRPANDEPSCPNQCDAEMVRVTP
jgi:ABC-type ATPase with predicted acetyltransferase domain